MAVSTNILRSWRDPRGVIRAMLAEGVREDRALAIAMGACVLLFLAQAPGLARAAHLDPTVPLDARIGGALLATVFLVPLLLYGLAAVSFGVMRAIGGRGSAYGARLALFWSLLATSPLMLVQGLLAGLLGPGLVLNVLGLLVLIVFLVQWGAALAEAGFPRPLVRG